MLFLFSMNEDKFKPIDAMPRVDLREKAFRKYERYINRALEQTYELDPGVELNMKPATFIARFKDAILGFQRYRYDSILFRQDADFRAIRLYELPTGFVRIVNTTQLAASNTTKVLKASVDKEQILALAKEYHYHSRDDQTFVSYDSSAERAWLIGLQTPEGDFSIDIRDFGKGMVVMRQ